VLEEVVRFKSHQWMRAFDRGTDPNATAGEIGATQNSREVISMSRTAVGGSRGLRTMAHACYSRLLPSDVDTRCRVVRARRWLRRQERIGAGAAQFGSSTTVPMSSAGSTGGPKTTGTASAFLAGHLRQGKRKHNSDTTAETAKGIDLFQGRSVARVGGRGGSSPLNQDSV